MQHCWLVSLLTYSRQSCPADLSCVSVDLSTGVRMLLPELYVVRSHQENTNHLAGPRPSRAFSMVHCWPAGSVIPNTAVRQISAVFGSIRLPCHPPTSAPTMPLNRGVSLNYGRSGPTVDAAAERSNPTQQHQQLLQLPGASQQYLSVNSSPRPSEPNSALSTPCSSRGSSLVYFTRFVRQNITSLPCYSFVTKIIESIQLLKITLNSLKSRRIVADS